MNQYLSIRDNCQACIISCAQHHHLHKSRFAVSSTSSGPLNLHDLLQILPTPILSLPPGSDCVSWGRIREVFATIFSTFAGGKSKTDPPSPPQVSIRGVDGRIFYWLSARHSPLPPPPKYRIGVLIDFAVLTMPNSLLSYIPKPFSPIRFLNMSIRKFIYKSSL